MKPKILFLYSELAGYFIACLKKLKELYDVEVHVIHWSVNKEAPFDFYFPSTIYFYDRNSLDEKELFEIVSNISPDIIFCAGWRDRVYLKIIRLLKNKVTSAICLDNQWSGSTKQRLAAIISRVTLLKIFTYCWVSGMKQHEYARHLGFKEKKIITGFYSADVDYFSDIAQKFIENKRLRFPHRFLFVGRYYEFKGILDLWEAFMSWKKATHNDWELWCLGTGDIKPVEHPSIRHFGFVQPENIKSIIRDTGVFVMPSRFEPWGVALHEYTSARYPVICSNIVGGIESYVRNRENGFIFNAGNIKQLIDCFGKIAVLDDNKLNKMGEISQQLAMTMTPTKWAATVMNLENNR